ncbi:uncharacterized protein LOC129899919 [Solanum dulcamara]|uniref:uncharacterized protein LOC129899919 n=1 Tax=Solanum dulcamara TaxID=45834 RepID=UPI0024865623|nr:uncharacterized protein LOC129899919 [Solanum dulcamara]
MRLHLLPEPQFTGEAEDIVELGIEAEQGEQHPLMDELKSHQLSPASRGTSDSHIMVGATLPDQGRSKSFERFLRLGHLRFDSAATEKVYDFLIECQDRLFNLGILEEHKFNKVFLKRFMPYSLRDLCTDKFVKGGTQGSKGEAPGSTSGGSQVGGDCQLCFAISSRPEVEASNAIITGFVLVFHHSSSVLFDPGYFSRVDEMGILTSFGHMIVFINDILVYSKNEADHVSHLRVILQILIDEKWYAKFSKCEFWLDFVAFLGCVVTKNDIMDDLVKVAAVHDWFRPTSIFEI